MFCPHLAQRETPLWWNDATASKSLLNFGSKKIMSFHKRMRAPLLNGYSPKKALLTLSRNVLSGSGEKESGGKWYREVGHAPSPLPPNWKIPGYAPLLIPRHWQTRRWTGWCRDLCAINIKVSFKADSHYSVFFEKPREILWALWEWRIQDISGTYLGSGYFDRTPENSKFNFQYIMHL